LRSDFQVTSSSSSVTTRMFLVAPPVTLVSTASASFVRGTSPSMNEVTTYTRWLAARSDSAPRSAAAFIFFGVRCAYDRGCGPCAVPPPVNCGARIEPCRARPVPFCR
jgi:hypothetical protein